MSKKIYVFEVLGPPPGIAGNMVGEQLEIMLDGEQVISCGPTRKEFFVAEGIGVESGDYEASGGRGATTMLRSSHYGVMITDAGVTGIGKHIEDWKPGDTFEITALSGPGERGPGNVRLAGIEPALNPVMSELGED